MRLSVGVDFDHLHELDARGVSWVTRAKDNFQYTVVRRLPVPASGRIRRDEIVRLKGPKGWTKKLQGWTLRRVEAWVEVDGKERVMVFITTTRSGLQAACAISTRPAGRSRCSSNR